MSSDALQSEKECSRLAGEGWRGRKAKRWQRFISGMAAGPRSKGLQDTGRTRAPMVQQHRPADNNEKYCQGGSSDQQADCMDCGQCVRPRRSVRPDRGPARRVCLDAICWDRRLWLGYGMSLVRYWPRPASCFVVRQGCHPDRSVCGSSFR